MELNNNHTLTHSLTLRAEINLTSCYNGKNNLQEEIDQIPSHCFRTSNIT